MVVASPQSVHYAITDLSSAGTTAETTVPGTPGGPLDMDLARWIAERVDVVQIREKRLDGGELFALATAAIARLNAVATTGFQPRLLINGRLDVAVAARAHGVHLTAQLGELRPDQVREVYRRAGLPGCTVSVSCHTLSEVARSREGGADLILFGPVFGKSLAGTNVVPGAGLAALREACAAAAPVPVLALGGITVAREPACLAAGAAGVAGIRRFAADVSLVP